ncbi:hypothetical protein D8674_025004 [Pyrus ussuriensis x Pyrus communis]|uniref:Uncharacterized protein n=1 Tax=Pyrus ussuriensis x Pyrus communis TaxID=2448454 RepID=A0A5N5H9N0_9ROSA|nr:hypothetical protein D8674_025004 [Pyrus ussuriensis x Pyrus communis]
MRQSSGVVAVEPRRGRGRGFRIELICGEVGDKLEGGEGVVGPGEWELASGSCCSRELMRAVSVWEVWAADSGGGGRTLKKISRHGSL